MAVKNLVYSSSENVLEMIQTVKGEELYYCEMEKEIAAEVIVEYVNVCRKLGIPHNLENRYVDELITNITRYGIKRYSVEVLLFEYFKLKECNNEEILENVMRKHNFNYTPSIRNAFYYLLGNPIDLADFRTAPMLWPGMKSIEINGNCYMLETEFGRIEVAKATPKFLKTNSNYIFKKPLMGKCYARTYEFVKANRDSYAILSKQPNFFVGTDYHAYVERNDEVIDIAANAYYDKKEFADKILPGEEIARLSFEEITDELQSLDLSDVKKHEKLYVLTAYHDVKNRMNLN